MLSRPGFSIFLLKVVPDFYRRSGARERPHSSGVPKNMHIDWSSFFGRLHPLIVHFPLALILVAALVDMVGCLRKSPPPPEVFNILFGFAAVGAIAASATGWWFAKQQENADGTLLQWHRWLGVGVAAIAGILWLSGKLPLLRPHRRWLLFVAAALVAVCGHLGGLLVWHDDYFN